MQSIKRSSYCLIASFHRSRPMRQAACSEPAPSGMSHRLSRLLYSGCIDISYALLYWQIEGISIFLPLNWEVHIRWFLCAGGSLNALKRQIIKCTSFNSNGTLTQLIRCENAIDATRRYSDRYRHKNKFHLRPDLQICTKAACTAQRKWQSNKHKS